MVRTNTGIHTDQLKALLRPAARYGQYADTILPAPKLFYDIARNLRVDYPIFLVDSSLLGNALGCVIPLQEDSRWRPKQPDSSHERCICIRKQNYSCNQLDTSLVLGIDYPDALVADGRLSGAESKIFTLLHELVHCITFRESVNLRVEQSVLAQFIHTEDRRRIEYFKEEIVVDSIASYLYKHFMNYTHKYKWKKTPPPLKDRIFLQIKEIIVTELKILYDSHTLDSLILLNTPRLRAA